MKTLNIIGCGRLGRTLAALISKSGDYQIAGVVNSTLSSAKEAVQFIGQGTAYANITELTPADITLIGVPDDRLEKICNELVAANVLKPNSILLHGSGFHSSEMLSAAKKIPCYVASVHPVRSFADPKALLNTFSGTYCVFEGDAEALPILKHIFEGIGGIWFTIDSKRKKRYHTGMVMANNYLVTLHFHATQHLIGAQIDELLAKKMVSHMMQDAFNNIATHNHAAALTGPIERGDLQTIAAHLNSIENDVERNMYAALGLGTLPLTSHSPELKKKIADLFLKH